LHLEQLAGQVATDSAGKIERPLETSEMILEKLKNLIATIEALLTDYIR